MINGLLERLKTLRMKYNYSQKELANLIDLSVSVVSGYETGEKNPSTEALLRLTGLYHCSADYLLGIVSKDTSTLIDVTGFSVPQHNPVYYNIHLTHHLALHNEFCFENVSIPLIAGQS